jgi:hypothetical protein
MQRTLAGAALAFLLACGAQRDGSDPTPGGGIDVARQWQCDEDGDTRVVCEGVTLADAEAPGAYACDDDDGREICPPASAFAELEEALEEPRLDAFVAVPWACLRTGASALHCTKDLTTPDETPPGDPPDGDPPDPSEPSDTPPGDDDPGSSAADPTPPSDCQPESWEPYFCALATAKYRQHGVDITFPCDIFDALAPFSSTFDEIPTGAGDPSLPSCHDGEWAMRDQAWLDAVGQGCLDLNDPILVLCQQAANWAPNSGACAATGTW